MTTGGASGTMMTMMITGASMKLQGPAAVPHGAEPVHSCPGPAAATPEAACPVLRFRAMNTDVLVVGGSVEIERWFREVEATLSRFDPESSLSQLNRHPGRWVLVPPLLHRAVQMALGAARATEGAFDPTILDALEAAGYSRSFELGPAQPAENLPVVRPNRWREIRAAPTTPAVWLPPGIRLDLGGIGKGLAVDGAMRRLRQAPRALVNAGGDLALRTAPGDRPVPVEIEDPFNPERTLATAYLYSGAVATSSILGRRWGRGLHHIIDPRTGRPAATGLVAATVFADTAVRAEVLAKSCIILGARRGLALLETQGCRGLMVSDDGNLILSPGMEEYMHAEA